MKAFAIKRRNTIVRHAVRCNKDYYAYCIFKTREEAELYINGVDGKIVEVEIKVKRK